MRKAAAIIALVVALGIGQKALRSYVASERLRAGIGTIVVHDAVQEKKDAARSDGNLDIADDAVRNANRKLLLGIEKDEENDFRYALVAVSLLVVSLILFAKKPL